MPRHASIVSPVLGLDDLGSASFNSTTSGGCNPCLINCAAPVGVESATWSSVKLLSRR